MLKILVLEDDNDWQMLYRNLFPSSDYLLETTSDIYEAKRLIGESIPQFDISIINMNLIPKIPSDQSGLELLDFIKREYPCIQRIVVTGNPGGPVYAKFARFDVSEILIKSGGFRSDDLKKTIENIMDKKEQYSDVDLYVSNDGISVHSDEGERSDQITVKAPTDIKLSLQLIEADNTNEELLKEFGKKLYDIIFTKPIHAHFNQTEAVARTKKQKLRMRLTIKSDEMADLPWEFLYREEGDYFFASNPNTVLSHYLDLPLPQNRVRKREGTLHLLLIIADPKIEGQPSLNPDKWEKLVTEALAEPLQEGKMTISVVKQATLDGIRDALFERKPDIIQFVGHGSYSKGKGCLALVDDTGGIWEVNDSQFANLFLGSDDNLGLVCLATCESAKSDSPQGFLGIAPKIVQRGVPAVVAMRYEVLISTAKIFLENFYKSVAARKPVDWAVQWGRNAISLKKGLDNREFATPVLFMRAKDGNIF